VPPVGAGPVIAMQLEAFDRGGLERVVFDLCCGLKDAGASVIVLCRSAGLLADEMKAHGIEVFVFDDAETHVKILKGNGVTHLLLHHSYFGFSAAQNIGVKVFDVVHNTYFWKKRDPDEVRDVGNRGSGVICVSSNVRDFHVRTFNIPLGNTRLINNPVNTDGLIIPETDQLRRIRTSLNHTTFLNVANFYPAKAQIALVAAFAQAYRQCPDIRLMIAGAESTPAIAAEIRRLVDQYGLRDVVTLVGHCDRRQLSRHYAQSHAFLLPSVFEGYSISAIEAAVFGLPLVMTDVGGARDLIEHDDCGVLLPAIVDDLASYTSDEVDQIGTHVENRATPELVDAMIAIARDRDAWIERGFIGMRKPRSLASVVGDYLAVIEASDGHVLAHAGDRGLSS